MAASLHPLLKLAIELVDCLVNFCLLLGKILQISTSLLQLGRLKQNTSAHLLYIKLFLLNRWKTGNLFEYLVRLKFWTVRS